MADHPIAGIDRVTVAGLPTDGWQLPIFAVSGDLVPLVDEATAEFEGRTAGLPPRAAVYDGIAERAGPYKFVRHQLVDDTAAIDIAFVGSSVLKGAIDADRVQNGMVERFGASANVRMLPLQPAQRAPEIVRRRGLDHVPVEAGQPRPLDP